MEASAHRARARDALRGNWVTAVLVSLVAGLLAGTSEGTQININFNFEASQPVRITMPEQWEPIVAAVGLALPMLLILLAVSLILGGVIELGYASYNLNLIDRRNPQFTDLFSCFSQFVPALVMKLLSGLLVFCGMLLFIIPGIMLTYSFAMAPYILAEYPQCGGWEALKRSRAMMEGHRAELFWLELTFLGWEILSAFTLGVGALLLNPYIAAARASFYRDLPKPERNPAEDWL